MGTDEPTFVARLARPVDPAGLATFRVLFGALMCASAVRFLAKGWVHELYSGPRFHFTYFGFDWVRPWSEPWMTLHVAALGLLGFALMIGVFTRAAAALHAIGFTYVELIDKSTYLNHYYLISLISVLCVVLPVDSSWSVMSWWRRRRGRPSRPTIFAHYALVRGQIAVVYLFAGAAKLNGDWLLRAQPLRIWLRQFWDVPWLGSVFAWSGSAYAMSWFGAVFDLGIVFAISQRRLRPWAWVLAAIFHATIGLMFPIGVFSFVMLAALTCFNDPSWARPLVGRIFGNDDARLEEARTSVALAASPPRAFVIFAVIWLTVQVAVPLRFALYPGPVNWTEQGFRFAWRVMLIEKTAHVEFNVHTRSPLADYVVDPRRELTALQVKMMSTQPDMILEYAQHLARLFGGSAAGAEVRAEVWMAFNGRRSQRLVNPRVDLAREERGLGPARWILPLEKP